MVRCGGEGVGFLKVIQKFGEAERIPEKEPSHHRLKSRGLPLEGGPLMAGPPTGPIPSSPHQVHLLWT